MRLMYETQQQYKPLFHLKTALYGLSDRVHMQDVMLINPQLHMSLLWPP